MTQTTPGWKTALGGVMVVALLVGCSRQPAPDAAPAEANLREAMKDGSAEVQQIADAAATAVEKQDTVQAFVLVNKLATAPDLTPDQRQAASRAAAAMREQLAKAATNGDPQAAALLQAYRSSK